MGEGLGIGIDLVDVDEVRAALAAHGERYLQRIFREPERTAAGGQPRRLAATFAAKEATLKALGRPADAPSVWREIEIHDAHAELHGSLARECGPRQVTIGWGGRDRTALAIAVAAPRGER